MIFLTLYYDDVDEGKQSQEVKYFLVAVMTIKSKGKKEITDQEKKKEMEVKKQILKN